MREASRVSPRGRSFRSDARGDQGGNPVSRAPRVHAHTLHAILLSTLFALAPLLLGCPAANAPTTETCDQPGIICTVAGTGQSRFDGDGRPALRTSLYFPEDVEFDPLGRPLVLDANNQRLRRIAEDTSMHTVIGIGEEGSPTEGALAVHSPLHHASDVAVDADGRIYIAGNHAALVFRIDLDDRVHLVAGNDLVGYDGDGGPALSARFMAPYGVLPLDDGSLYIADIQADVIRFVDAAGVISTIAGDGTRGYSGDGGPATSAQLSGPSRLARDTEGAVLFCDTNNHVIRRLNLDGTITTIAGTGAAGYTGDSGSATDAQLNSPLDVRVTQSGDIYVADTGNNVIRRIRAGGIITTIVGTGVPGFSGDGGAAGACQLNGPTGVNLDADGNLWIADTFNQRVRRVAKRIAE